MDRARRRAEEERAYAYWLCNVEGVGDRTIRRLTEEIGSPGEIYFAEERRLSALLKPRQLEQMRASRQRWDVQKEYDALVRGGIGFYMWEDEEYPERLRHIPDPPYGLFCLGGLPQDSILSVAVIGARECSEYGRFVASGLGRVLGERGIQVISGMAKGIDGISQKAALDAGGISFGVLGCGVDVCYPESNRGLYDRLQQKGGILSAYPPGTLPRAQNFPPRNRIVSGLADVIVVVEARAKSGTLITVDMALEQGREVYVVPGRITDRLSDGCNRLLRQGAGVLLSPCDFLEEIADKCDRLSGAVQRAAGEECPVSSDREKRAALSFGGEEGGGLPSPMRQLYEALDFYPRSLRDILESLPGEQREYPMKVNAMLLELCMRQLAVQVSPGHFCLRRE